MALPPVVTQLIVESSGAVEGVKQFEAAMARAKAAAIDAGSATATSFETAQRRWVNALGATDPVIKAQIKMQDDMARQQLIGNNAVALGVATQAAAAAQLDKVRQKHEANIQAIREQTGQLTLGEKAMAGFASATSGVTGQLIALSAGAGPVGVFLSALGPFGLAAAVALGAASAGISEMIRAAERMGDRATQMSNFAIATGFTVDQVRALTRQSTLLGLSGDQVRGWLEKFAVNLDAARRGTGPLAEGLDRIDHGLLVQLEGTRTNAAAWDIFALAATRAGLSVSEFMKVSLGRGSAQAAILTAATAAAGGLDAMTASQNKFKQGTSDQIEQWKRLNNELAEAKERVDQSFAKMFTTEVLTKEIEFFHYLEKIAALLNQIKDFKLPSLTEMRTNLLGAIPQVVPRVQPGGDSLIGGQSAALVAKGLSWLAWLGSQTEPGLALVGARGVGAISGIGWGATAVGAMASPRYDPHWQTGGADFDRAFDLSMQDWKRGQEQFKASVDFWDTITSAFKSFFESKAAQTSVAAAPGSVPAPGAPLAMLSTSLGNVTAASFSDVAIKADDLRRKLLDLAGVAGDTRNSAAIANEWKEIAAVLGGAQTPAEHFKATMLDLAAAAEKSKGNPALLAAIGRATDLAFAEQALQVTQNLVGALGPLATAEQQEQSAAQKVATERARGIHITQSQEAALKLLALAQAEVAHVNEAASVGVFDFGKALKAAQDDIDGNNAKLKAWGFAAIDAATAQQIMADKIRAASEAAALAGTPFKEFTRYLLDGANANKQLDQTFVSLAGTASSSLGSLSKDVLNGTDKMQALANVAKSLRDTLIDMAAKQIVNATLSGLFSTGTAGASQTAGATGAGSIWMAAGATFNTALIAAATTAAGIMTGGAAVDATTKIAATTEAAVIQTVVDERSSVLKLTTALASAAAEVAGGEVWLGLTQAGAAVWAFATQNWIALLAAAVAAVAGLFGLFSSSEDKAKEAEDARKAADAAQAQSVTLTGGGSGNIQSQVAQTWSQTLGVALQLQATKQWTRMYQLLDDFDAYAARIHDNFARSWQGMVDQLNAGLGDNGPFGAAIANVQQLSQQVQDFVDNTQFLTTSGAGAGGFTQTQVQQAQQAGQNFLLSLIQGQQPLSTVATELARINGTASALQGALAQLGLSATAAATAISQQVTQALDKLRNDTIASLTQRLNVATGQGFLNDVSAAVLQHQQDLSDAVSLGLSTNLVDQVFAAEVQKVVNDSGLVGDAFAALTRQFPALVGVVHEATAAVQDQATAQANLNRGAGTVVDYLNSLTSGPNAALSPQALLGNAQSAYNANLTLAQGGNVDAVNKFPQLADDLEKAAKAMFGSAMGYQDIRSQIISQGLGLPAVQQADDPVVVAVRDVLDAINAGSAAQATNATLLSVAANTGTLLTSAQLSALGLAQNTTVASLLTQSQLSALGLAANATVSGLLTAAQLAQAGLASNPTLVNTNTAIGTLLTQAQLSATGLASNATVGTLLTAAQLAQAGLATNATTAGLLTGAQMVALGLASNTAVGALLTQSQLSALGLAANTTVSGLLTAAQLASAGLATNPTLVNTNTAIGTLLTQAQLSAIGLASNTTVGTLLTAAQLAQAGLATNAVTSGLLTQSQVSGLGLALNATAAGLLTSAQMQALGLATNTTAATIANSAGNVATNTGAGGVIVTNLGSGTDAQLAGNDLLAAIQSLNSTQVSTLGLLNNQFAGHVVDYTTQTGGGAGGVGTTFSVTLANNMIDALNKIAFNTFAIAANTFDISAHTGGNFNSHSGTYRGFYAQGGTAPPFSDFVYGEHHPGGPFFGRAGAEPVTFSPGFPSNDNGAVVASVDRLSQRVAAQTQTIANLLARIAQLEERTGDEVAEGNDISRNGWDDFRKNRPRPVSGHGRTA